MPVFLDDPRFSSWVVVAYYYINHNQPRDGHSRPLKKRKMIAPTDAPIGLAKAHELFERGFLLKANRVLDDRVEIIFMRSSRVMDDAEDVILNAEFPI